MAAATTATIVSVQQLLDTPKRTSIQSQLHQSRAALKDFERTFAANNGGRKPSKEDIKTDHTIAAKYKEYNKLRDVLDGKLDYAVLTAAAGPKSPLKRRASRRDSGISGTPKKTKHSTSTLVQSPLSSRLIDDCDAPDSVSPRPLLLQAIGPTPQRDGRVLGLFDLLSNSGCTDRGTVSGTKRKIDDLMVHNSQADSARTLMAQTPSRRSTAQTKSDLLEFLTGTPAKTPETGRRKHSRTPVSDGRKFMLSQFFATPSTVRHSTQDKTQPLTDLTPLRDRVPGVTPDNKAQTLQPAADVTPAYLRRSTSFKDRLLSVSQSSSFDGPNGTQMSITRTGPPTLRHFRSMPKMFKMAITEPQEVAEQEEYDDDMDALREMEGDEVNALDRDVRENSPSENNSKQDKDVSQRIWKKKGQKRTTRKSKIRPTRGPIAQAPTFVLAGNDSEGEANEQIAVKVSRNQEEDCGDGSHPDDVISDVEYDDVSDQEYLEAEKAPPKNQSSKNKGKTRQEDKVEKKKKSADKGATINPNATSHMNFRSLKIKNKNSKAHGRGRFSRGRR